MQCNVNYEYATRIGECVDPIADFILDLGYFHAIGLALHQGLLEERATAPVQPQRWPHHIVRLVDWGGWNCTFCMCEFVASKLDI